MHPTANAYDQADAPFDDIAAMEGDKAQNIPHMHLFLVLKRQFPELRDADVTECIQRFGLDKEQCEKELVQRINEQQKIYYSPWSPRRPSSRSSDASPSSNSDMPLTNGDDALSSPSIVPKKIDGDLSQDLDQRASAFGDNRDLHSAPVYASHNHVAYQPTGRRKSAEAASESRKLGVLHKLSEHPETEDDENGETFSPDRSVSPYVDSPAGTPTTNPSSAHASTTMSSSSQYSEASSRDVDVAVINEQLKRRSKLEGELKYRKEEQSKLDDEIKILRGEHEGKENDQKRDIDDCKKRIENLMKENNYMSSDCDIMSQKILEEYDDPSLALEKRDNQGIPDSTDVNTASSPFTNKLSDRSYVGDFSSDRHATARTRPVAPSSATIYTQRHQDRNHLTENVECDWSCCKCTFLNHATLSNCEMCGFVNFPGGASENASCYCHRRFDYDQVARTPVSNS